MIDVQREGTWREGREGGREDAMTIFTTIIHEQVMVGGKDFNARRDCQLS